MLPIRDTILALILFLIKDTNKLTAMFKTKPVKAFDVNAILSGIYTKCQIYNNELSQLGTAEDG